MINKLSIISLIVILCVGFSASTNASGMGVDNHDFLNKDGSRVVVEYSNHQRQAIVSLISSRGTKQLLKLKANESNGEPFFSVALIDIDKDGFGDIERTGNCGNRVCDKIIYRFYPQSGKYTIFFKGAYSTAQIDGGFFIVGGGSGCCAYEYQVYEIERKYFSVKKRAHYTVTVSNFDEGQENRTECTFSDDSAKTISPPQEHWKELCEIYGKNYKLILP